MKDPIVEEVREHRKEHTQKFHGDLSEICKDLRRVQETSGHDIIRLASRRLEPMTELSRNPKGGVKGTRSVPH